MSVAPESDIKESAPNVGIDLPWRVEEYVKSFARKVSQVAFVGLFQDGILAERFPDAALEREANPIEITSVALAGDRVDNIPGTDMQRSWGKGWKLMSIYPEQIYTGITEIEQLDIDQFIEQLKSFAKSGGAGHKLTSTNLAHLIGIPLITVNGKQRTDFLINFRGLAQKGINYENFERIKAALEELKDENFAVASLEQPLPEAGTGPGKSKPISYELITGEDMFVISLDTDEFKKGLAFQNPKVISPSILCTLPYPDPELMDAVVQFGFNLTEEVGLSRYDYRMIFGKLNMIYHSIKLDIEDILKERIIISDPETRALQQDIARMLRHYNNTFISKVSGYSQLLPAYMSSVYNHQVPLDEAVGFGEDIERMAKELRVVYDLITDQIIENIGRHYRVVKLGVRQEIFELINRIKKDPSNKLTITVNEDAESKFTNKRFWGVPNIALAMLANFIDNIRSEKEDANVEVTLYLEEIGDGRQYLRVRIRDNAGGMSQGRIDQVMRKGTNGVDSTHGGTGTGLATSVRIHRGIYKANSNPISIQNYGEPAVIGLDIDYCLKLV